MFKSSLFSLVGVMLLGSTFLISCSSDLDPGDFELEITALNSGSESSLRAIHIVDKNIIWAGGSGGQYLLSANGGESWKIGEVAGAEGDDLRSVSAWSATNAQFFGTSSHGRGYMTETSGEDWDIIYENSSEGIFFNTLKYADSFRGMALSDPIDSISFLIRTADGGKSWERVTGLPLLNEGEFNFAASNSCIDYKSSGNVWIVTGGGDSRVFSSKNHGDTWIASGSGIINGIASSGIFSVSFLDDEKGIIVGGTYDKPELNDRIAAFTLDGGERWILSEVMPAEYRSCVFWLKYRGRDIAVAVGKTGIDISTDHGNSWSNLSEDGYYTGRAVPGTNIGYLAGSEGRISRIELKLKRSKPDQELTDNGNTNRESNE